MITLFGKKAMDLRFASIHSDVEELCRLLAAIQKTAKDKRSARS